MFAFLTRWVLAVGFLSLAVGVLVHVAPATHQPLPWVSLGATIVTVWWVIVPVGFYFYLTGLASYGSVFGAQLDAIIRAQATGTLSGVEAVPPLPSQPARGRLRTSQWID